MNTYQQGNGVRLTAEFRDWDGALKDPQLVKVIVYDANFVKLGEWPMTAANHTGIGKYQFDYVPVQFGIFYYEWYGELDGFPSLRREKMEVRRV
jgi:hypothetical protein